MSQPRNNLEAFNRQLSAGRAGGGASSGAGASTDARPTAGKSKFKPANTGGNDPGASHSQGTGGFRPVRAAPAAGVRKGGSLQTFSTPNFGKNKAAPSTASHSQPVPEARIPAINTPRVQSAAARFTPAHKSSPAPRISAGGTIDLSPSGSESSMRAHAATTARKRQSGEVPLMPPAAGVKRLKTSPTPSERGSPVGEAEKENRAMYSSAEKGKGRVAASSSLASSQTLPEVTNEASLAGLDNEDLHSKSVTELQHLAMFNMETVSQLKKDRKAFDIKLKTDQDVYLLDAFIRLAESRASAIDDALVRRARGDAPKPPPAFPPGVSQPHDETQVMDDDFEIPPSPPPPQRQANFSHNSNHYSNGVFNPDDEAEFDAHPPPPRQQSHEASRHSSSDVPPRQQSYDMPFRHLPPMLELSPDPEPLPREPSPEPELEPEPEVTEIMSDDEAGFWNYGPTTQDLDESEAFDDNDIEILDAPLIPAAGSVGTIAAASSVSLPGPTNDFNPKKSRHYNAVMRVLRDSFQLESFRPNQLEAIIATLDGRDVFTLMPTGGGKSLCFQLPAIVSPGVTVVFSPLIALMLDQTRELEQRGIRTVWYNMEMSSADRSAATQALLAPADHKPNMVYMTPERLAGNDQMNNVLTTLYKSGLLARFVIDEAHLLHTWGRNFRGSFLDLKLLRQKWPTVPIIALTATATPTAQVDIMSILGMRPNTLRLSQSFNRPNLRYRVLIKPRNVIKEMVQFINTTHPGKTGIVYCMGRDKCEKVADQLTKEGIAARYFHAQMDSEDKKRVFEAWMDGRTKVVVATVAFGMGINKPDVRFVIHHDVPSSMANYLQETGRAGRDGLISDCVLYYLYRDSEFLLRRVRENKDLSPQECDRLQQEVRDIIEFATNTIDCRRAQILARFDESFDPDTCNRTCDNCQSNGEVITVDCSQAASGLVQLQREAQAQNILKVPRGTLVAAFRGKSPKEVIEKGLNGLQSFGAGKDLEMGLAERIFDRLVALGAFKTVVEVVKYPAIYVRLGDRTVYEPWLAGRANLEMRTRVPLGKSKRAPAGSRTNSRKKATTRAELQSDPIEDDDEDEPAAAAPSRSLWQDDDEADATYAPEPDEPVAGPSRPRAPATRTKPASRRAPPPEPEPEPEPETVEVAEPGVGEDWHDVCYRRLLEVREQVCLTEGLVEPEDIMSDQCLQMLSLNLPADGSAFTAVLADEYDDENLANEKFRKYGRRLLDVCTTYCVRSSSRSVPPTPTPVTSTSTAGQAKGKKKFKPANPEPSLPSASQLHRAYDYQGTPKPPSGRGR
ncbi:ATP-dependent DNA helicase [Peniophora sp. CONT]|nr:ATP-dependent DNA helicase [Peniophora sp. CONT]